MQSRFAVVDGERREAQPGLSGECAFCGAAMVAKCGEIRIHHWAHRSTRMCDNWWEPETEWHRRWKDKFPVEWQEVLHRADGGEKHIADVKTKSGLVIEFQHSYLRADERRAREAFYQRLVWVIDGLRLKRDKPNFYEALRCATIRLEPSRYRVFTHEASILRHWIGSRAVVLFDFGDAEPVLWRLHAVSPSGFSEICPESRAAFMNLLTGGAECANLAVKFIPPTAVYPPHKMAFKPHPTVRRRTQSFAQYLAAKRRAQSRKRF